MSIVAALSLISCAGGADRALIDQIRERIENLVCIEWSMDGVDSVGFNRHEAAWKAATHLVEKGFRRLRYIGPDDERVAGFRQALLEASIPVHPDDVRLSSNAPDGYRVCRE